MGQYVGVTAVERLGQFVVPGQPEIPAGYRLIAVAESLSKIARDVTRPEDFKEFFEGRIAGSPEFRDFRIQLFLVVEGDIRHCRDEGAVPSTLLQDIQERQRQHEEFRRSHYS